MPAKQKTTARIVIPKTVRRLLAKSLENYIQKKGLTCPSCDGKWPKTKRKDRVTACFYIDYEISRQLKDLYLPKKFIGAVLEEIYGYCHTCGRCKPKKKEQD